MRSIPLAGVAFIASLGPAAWFQYGIGITVAGAGVSVWADQSGNGRDLKQGTDTNRPALQLDGSILFDGVDNFLKCDAFTLNQPETVYGVFKQITWTANDYLWDGNANNTMALFQRSSTPNISLQAGTTGTAFSNQLVLDTYGVVAGVYNGASSLIQVNSNAAITGDAGANNAGGFTLGVRGATTSTFAHMQAKEFIIFPAAHDAETRARVLRYLAGV